VFDLQQNILTSVRRFLLVIFYEELRARCGPRSWPNVQHFCLPLRQSEFESNSKLTVSATC